MVRVIEFRGIYKCVCWDEKNSLGYKLLIYIFANMRRYNDNYSTVEQLPVNAMKVKDYADTRHCNTAYIYKLWAKVKRGEKTPEDIGFTIVLFHDINFVIPL